MKYRWLTIFILLIFANIATAESVPLRNIITIEGMQDNPVLGYGIVVGLKGTGDNEKGSQTREILARIANNYGFVIDPDLLKPKNSAIVLVTAMIPPYSAKGSRLDVRVSSIYNAKSLEGGELIITPLLGGNNKLYAIAQGKLVTHKSYKSVSGTISLGGIVQREIPHKMVNDQNEITLLVSDRQGLDSVYSVRKAVTQKFPGSVSETKGHKIRVKIPDGIQPHEFLSQLYKLSAEVEMEPIVVIDSKSGILVSGGNVVISPAAISFNNTSVSIGASDWGSGDGAETPKNVQVIPRMSTVTELADGLNQIGANTSDIIKILQLLQKSGNLKAKVLVQ